MSLTRHRRANANPGFFHRASLETSSIIFQLKL